MKKWYDIRAQAGGAEIIIYDEIGYWGITAKDFLDDLKALGPVAEITVRINSPGGMVFDGLAIHNALKRHAAKVTVYVDGIAASIASVIVMAGDTVVMPENALMMIHDPMGFAVGNAETMKEMAEILDKIKASLVSAYRNKTGLEDEKIAELMAAETWLSAAEAVEMGFADAIEAPMEIAATFDLSRFENLTEQAKAFSRAASAAPNPGNGKEQSMSDATKKAAKAAEPPAETPAGGNPPAEAENGDAGNKVVDIDAARVEGRASAVEIVNMCNLAGFSGKAAGYLAENKTTAEVQADLLAARAAADNDGVSGQHMAVGGGNPAPVIDRAKIYAARNAARGGK